MKKPETKKDRDKRNMRGCFWDLVDRPVVFAEMERIGKSAMRNTYLPPDAQHNLKDMREDLTDRLTEAFATHHLPLWHIGGQSLLENRNEANEIVAQKKGIISFVIPYSQEKTRTPHPIVCHLTYTVAINDPFYKAKADPFASGRQPDRAGWVGGEWKCEPRTIEQTNNILYDNNLCSFTNGYRSNFITNCSEKFENPL